MADIELVIKIPNHLYKLLKEFPSDSNEGNIENVLMKAVEHGAPLPKGHGVLKDVDAMINRLCTQEASELFGSVTCAEILDFINDEKPIIEADKEYEDGNDA